jgi:hypothetical protein
MNLLRQKENFKYYCPICRLKLSRNSRAFKSRDSLGIFSQDSGITTRKRSQSENRIASNSRKGEEEDSEIEDEKKEDMDRSEERNEACRRSERIKSNKGNYKGFDEKMWEYGKVAIKLSENLMKSGISMPGNVKYGGATSSKSYKGDEVNDVEKIKKLIK